MNCHERKANRENGESTTEVANSQRDEWEAAARIAYEAELEQERIEREEAEFAAELREKCQDADDYARLYGRSIPVPYRKGTHEQVSLAKDIARAKKAAAACKKNRRGF